MYHGFTNKSTWLAYNILRDKLQDTLRNFFENANEDLPVFTNMLKSFIQTNNPLSQSGESIYSNRFYNELLNKVLHEIEYEELCQRLFQELYDKEKAKP